MRLTLRSLFLCTFISLTVALGQDVAYGCLNNALGQLNEDFVPSRYLGAAQQSHPKLFRIFTSRSLQRWKNSNDNGWKQLFEKIAQCKESPCHLGITGETFAFNGDLTLYEDKIELRVNSFIAKQYNKKKGRWEGVPYGDTPSGISLAFYQMLGVCAEGVAAQIDSNKKINRVRIYADDVVNTTLAKTLQELGFVRAASDIDRYAAMSGRAGSKKSTFGKSWEVILPVQR